MILSLIISGPRAPVKDFDVYLLPLIHELKFLWEGVDVFYAFKREAFKLKVALMWTINDFPAYANLSGWTKKGYYACPSCTQSTHSMYLPFGRKTCYMGHHIWLLDDHPF